MAETKNVEDIAQSQSGQSMIFSDEDGLHRLDQNGNGPQRLFDGVIRTLSTVPVDRMSTNRIDISPSRDSGSHALSPADNSDPGGASGHETDKIGAASPPGTVGDYIDDVEAGSVVVLDNGGREHATVWGDILTWVAHRRGVAGPSRRSQRQALRHGRRLRRPARGQPRLRCLQTT